MNKKQNELLKYLASCHKPKKSTELANALQISARSVKNYVSEINDIYNKKIILSSRNGYELNRIFATELLIGEDNDQIPQTAEERAFYIIRQLITDHSSRLELFDLCDYLCISYSTIKTVIAMMNKMFASYEVKFVCEKDCVKMVGTEKNKRKLISYVINEESQSSFVDIEHLQNCFPQIDIHRLRDIIIRTLKKYSYYLNDFAAINVLLHLLILIDRESRGKALDLGVASFKAENELEYQLVLELCSRLEEEFSICLNPSERTEIYLLFKTNANFSLPSTKSDLETLIGEELLSLTDNYVEQVNNLFMIDLNSPSFKATFALHLKNLVYRARQGRYTANPMKDSLRLNNPIIFDIAIYLGLELTERYQLNLNDDEMAFLAMHIGAELERQNASKSKVPAVLLCPNYHELSVNLLHKLMLNFGHQIDILGNVRLESELSQLPHFSLLFTTIPLHRSYDCTVVQLSPFNLSSQYETIQNAILLQQNQYKNHILKKNFHIFFEEELFVSDTNLETRSQVLTFLCDRLQLKNYVKPDFEEKVYKRENAASTAFGSIAIPHSVDMDAIKTCVTVATSKKGIRWGENTVHLVLLLAINRADRKTFRELYESLISIFQEERIIQAARNCASFHDFQSLVYTHVDASGEAF